MKSKNIKSNGQGDFFKSRLDQILNPKHPLFRLAGAIDWEYFEGELGALFVDGQGRPALPVRLVVGLHYLKHAFNESDESVVERFLENPYWQYFCGFEFFQHELPLEPTSLVKWRNRIGVDGIEKLLAETIATGKRGQLLKKSDFLRVNVDTTVQEKAVSFPTDAKLYHKARTALVKAAEERDIELRQSYSRLGKKALRKQASYSHARQTKRAKRELKKLRTYLGCVIRDIDRKCNKADNELLELISTATKIYKQKRTDKNKVYSLHAPEVECIAKGKAHKRYEFGCKVSVVSTSKSNWVVGVDALHGNPYDGHTLKGTLDQAERLTGYKVEEAYVDRGYKGSQKTAPETVVNIARNSKLGLSKAEWRWFKRRSAIEPVIGHMKSDNRMGRNFLSGEAGDRMNAMLAGCGFNLRKLIRAFLRALFRWLFLRKPTENKIFYSNPKMMVA